VNSILSKILAYWFLLARYWSGSTCALFYLPTW